MILYLFFTTLIVPLTIAGIGLFWKKNPPRKINNFYGYRSKMSMKNQETWDFANTHCSIVMWKTGIIMTIFSLIYIFISLIINTDYLIASIYVNMIQVIILVLCLFSTERVLKRNFDANGNKITTG